MAWHTLDLGYREPAASQFPVAPKRVTRVDLLRELDRVWPCPVNHVQWPPLENSNRHRPTPTR